MIITTPPPVPNYRSFKLFLDKIYFFGTEGGSICDANGFRTKADRKCV
jgi:hypothetical protein